MGRARAVYMGGVAAGLCACRPAQEPHPRDALRPLCGWEELRAEEPALRFTPDGAVAGSAAPGHRVAVIDTPGLRFGAVAAALGPMRERLVRVEAVVDGRWLLPMTLAGQAPVPWPPATATEEVIVGRRQVVRAAGAPAERVADLYVAEGRVALAAEGESPRGRTVALAELAALLGREEPPIGSFVLAAAADCPWAELVAALAAAACYDRAPGAEPHEVLLAIDAVRRPPGAR